MKAYKQTLNLPNTTFPMRASLATRELEILERWRQQDLYGKIRAQNSDKPIFVLHDGPPYANGSIHLGHALNKVLKDFILKAKGLAGFNAPYIPGWDCHGLAIEIKVEQADPGLKPEGAEGFRQACRAYASSQVEAQKAEFIRLGVLGDWSHPYQTLDACTAAHTIRTLAQVMARGDLYRGALPVHWCTACESALAEAELEYQPLISRSLTVRFAVSDPQAVAELFGIAPVSAISALIWTTTPWTLPANYGLAVNPDLVYQLVQLSQPHAEYVILAEACAEAVLARPLDRQWKVVGSCRGRQLLGQSLAHPFLDRQVPFVLASHVTGESGTGIVHTAPAHGPEDFSVAKQYGLPIESPVGGDGRFISTSPVFAGEAIGSIDAPMVAMLAATGALFEDVPVEHSYPHCWRHKSPLIYRATPQWFISLSKQGLRARALAAIERVQWIPAWGEKRIKAMLTQRPDWCLSRQRLWGVPMPIFLDRKTGDPHPDSVELMEIVAKRVEREGTEAWWRLGAEELLGDQAVQYRKETDVLDVWFESGSTFASVVSVHPSLGVLQSDLCLEGSDQHRGWFMSSLLLSVATRAQAPYRQVLTHGFTVDSQGKKMSKSLGNVISPPTILNKYGADILRLWVASTDYRAEMSLSQEILDRTTDSYRRIRNTARFLLGNIHTFDPARDSVPIHAMVAIDRWAVSCAEKYQREIRQAYDQYDFHQVVQLLMQFCSVDMGAFYLDIIKDRQYTAQHHGLPHRSCQTALYLLLSSLVRWIAPVLSFTAEEIWSHLPSPKSASVFLTEWYPLLEPLSEQDVCNARFWAVMIGLRQRVCAALEGARGAQQIKSGLEAAVTLRVAPPIWKLCQPVLQELHFLYIVSAVTVICDESAFVAADDASAVEAVHIEIGKAAGQKCPRCWHYTQQGPLSTEILCARCQENVTGAGEVRLFI